MVASINEGTESREKRTQTDWYIAKQLDRDIVKWPDGRRKNKWKIRQIGELRCTDLLDRHVES